MVSGSGSSGDRERRTKGFYALLLVLGVLLIMLAVAGHYWLVKLEERRLEEARQAALSRGAEKRPTPAPSRPQDGVERPDAGGASSRPVDNVEPEAGTRENKTEVSPSDDRVGEIVRELEGAKPGDSAEPDEEEKGRWQDCCNNFKQIGLYLCLWTSKYGQEKYYPSADPEGAVKQMLVDFGGGGESGLLQCMCCGTPQKYFFVPDLPKNAMDVLPPTALIAYESQPNRKGERHVLFMDGHVERLLEAGFQEKLAKHAEALKALED